MGAQHYVLTPAISRHRRLPSQSRQRSRISQVLSSESYKLLLSPENDILLSFVSLLFRNRTNVASSWQMKLCNEELKRQQRCSCGHSCWHYQNFLGQFLLPSYNIWHIIRPYSAHPHSADPVLHIRPNIFSPYLAENYQLTGKVLKNKQAHISDHREREFRGRLSSKQTNFKFLNGKCKKLFESLLKLTQHHIQSW